jgi:signal transduction histidine kinase
MAATRALIRAEQVGVSLSSEQWRAGLIVALVVLATVLHYGIDVSAGAVHDVLLRAYYLPIVLAGLWFGARGGLLTAAVVSLVFFPHALHGWHAPYTFAFRLIEMLMYHVIGALTGVMSSRARLALAAEKAARLEREQAYDDLRAKTRLLFEMEEQLRRSERLAALGRMSAGLAHEIRNPLASIKTSVEMLEEKTAGQKDPSGASPSIDLLQVLGEETERLNRILTEFLRFARVETRQEAASTAECVIAEVLAGTASLVRQEMAAAGVKIEYDAEQLGVTVAVGEDHLRQVLLNLLLNAFDAMPEGGAVQIELVSESAGALTIAVEDSGHGVPEEIAGSVFDPFFSTKEGGVGLGLSIVARLLDSCGGSIQLDRSHTTGARFLVTLPQPDVPGRR